MVPKRTELSRTAVWALFGLPPAPYYDVGGRERPRHGSWPSPQRGRVQGASEPPAGLMAPLTAAFDSVPTSP